MTFNGSAVKISLHAILYYLQHNIQTADIVPFSDRTSQQYIHLLYLKGEVMQTAQTNFLEYTLNPPTP